MNIKYIGISIIFIGLILLPFMVNNTNGKENTEIFRESKTVLLSSYETYSFNTIECVEYTSGYSGMNDTYNMKFNVRFSCVFDNNFTQSILIPIEFNISKQDKINVSMLRDFRKYFNETYNYSIKGKELSFRPYTLASDIK